MGGSKLSNLYTGGQVIAGVESSGLDRVKRDPDTYSGIRYYGACSSAPIANLAVDHAVWNMQWYLGDQRRAPVVTPGSDLRPSLVSGARYPRLTRPTYTMSHVRAATPGIE